MSKSKIEWTDETWNPTTGCDQVSPGCDHCYALTMAGRLKLMGSAPYQNDGDPRTSGPGFGLTLHEDRLLQPLRWTKPRKVFVNSMSDLFHKDVPDDFIAQVFAVMGLATQHTFQVLTKRPQRMANLLNQGTWPQRVYRHFPKGYKGSSRPLFENNRLRPFFPNVWLGTSIENDRYTFRADYLRATPAAVRFLSCEPLLSHLGGLDLREIDWVIVGGESGPKARPMDPDWARMIRDLCQRTETPFLFKQWGEWCPDFDVATGKQVGESMTRMGKHAAGRDLDGRTWDEYPS